MTDYTPGSAQWRENEDLKARLTAAAGRRLDAELDEYRPGARSADKREALAHSLRHVFGLRVKDPHPLAADVVSGRREFSVVQAMSAALELEGRPMPPDASARQIVQAAATTAHLPSLLTETLRGVTATEGAGNEHLAALSLLTRDNVVPDFRIASYSRAGLENVPEPGSDTDSIYHFMQPIVTAEGVQAHSVFARILWAEQAIMNDDRGYVQAALASWVSSSLRKQMQMFCNLLESNPTLTEDGRALFNAADGNLADPGGAPSETSLNVARSALRHALTAGGEKADARATTLLVPAEMETSAHRAMNDLPAEHRMTVIATSYLTDSAAWYVLASPAQHPVIARTRLEGSDFSAVSLSGIGPASFTAADGKHHEFPGVSFEVSHSVGFAAVGRTGIYKNSGA